jgi:hypothetical protein
MLCWRANSVAAATSSIAQSVDDRSKGIFRSVNAVAEITLSHPFARRL